jgi:hypothetical protein
MGIVCSGRMGDLAKLRDSIKASLNIDLIFNTMSSEYLFIVKKSKLTVEQKDLFEKEKKVEE